MKIIDYVINLFIQSSSPILLFRSRFNDSFTITSWKSCISILYFQLKVNPLLQRNFEFRKLKITAKRPKITKIILRLLHVNVLMNGLLKKVKTLMKILIIYIKELRKWKPFQTVQTNEYKFG